MNNWGGSVTAHDDDGQTGRNILRRWQDCRTPGAPIPSYEAVVLGSLGRLADRAALVTTRNGQAARILWAGQEFGAWLAQGSEGPSAEPCPSETVSNLGVMPHGEKDGGRTLLRQRDHAGGYGSSPRIEP